MKTVHEFIAYDDYLWERFGVEYGYQLEPYWDDYKKEISRKITSPVSRTVWEGLESEHRYSLIQALKELDELENYDNLRMW